MPEKIYTASRFSKGNLFFPISIIISEREVTLKLPSFFSGKSRSIVYQQIEGVNRDTPMLGFSTITFIVGGESLVAHGFTKATAGAIRQICSDKIAVTMAQNQRGAQKTSVADELMKLKNLVDSSVINQAEFEEQKTKLLRG